MSVRTETAVVMVGTHPPRRWGAARNGVEYLGPYADRRHVKINTHRSYQFHSSVCVFCFLIRYLISDSDQPSAVIITFVIARALWLHLPFVVPIRFKYVYTESIRVRVLLRFYVSCWSKHTNIET